MQIVTKPYMQRRARATFEAQWPDQKAQFIMSAPRLSFVDYPDKTQPLEILIHIIVGDFQRLSEYAKRGFQTPQIIPLDVQLAWNRLVAAGYTKRLID